MFVRISDNKRPGTPKLSQFIALFMLIVVAEQMELGFQVIKY